MWTSPSRLLSARVVGQFGLVTRAQLVGAGVSLKTLECHLRAGRWVRVHRGVYLTTPGRRDWSVRATAALLFAGDGAALSRASAGYAWGLVRAEPHLVEVVVPSSRIVRNRPGVAVTRSRYALERVDPHAWPHRVQAAHTVFDLAVGHPVDRAITLAARAIDLRLASSAELAGALAARARQAYRAVLLEALGDVATGSESAAEVRYVRDVERAHGLPTSRRQVRFGRNGRRDAEYEGFGVVVEIDGRLGHAAWTDQQRDGRRDRTAAVTGRVTLRCYWTDLVPSPCELAVEVGAVLRQRGWRDWLRPCGVRCAVRRVAGVTSGTVP